MKQKILFSESECNYLKSFIQRNDIVKTSNDAYGSFNTTICVIPPNEIPSWFKNKLKEFDISNILFENKLASSRSVIVNKYGTNGYFAKHKDDYSKHTSWKYRYKTLIIQLSKSDSYRGGDLLVDDVSVDRTIGNTILFDASTYHELTKITEGERYSLVIWFDRDDITKDKNLL
jgi:hypothetical protein